MEVDGSVERRLEKLRRLRTGKKTAVTKRIARLDGLVEAGQCSRRQIRFLMEKLSVVLDELTATCDEISEINISLKRDDDALNDLVDVRMDVDECLALVSDHLESRHDEVSSSSSGSTVGSWVSKNLEMAAGAESDMVIKSQVENTDLTIVTEESRCGNGVAVAGDEGAGERNLNLHLPISNSNVVYSDSNIIRETEISLREVGETQPPLLNILGRGESVTSISVDGVKDGEAAVDVRLKSHLKMNNYNDQRKRLEMVMEDKFGKQENIGEFYEPNIMMDMQTVETDVVEITGMDNIIVNDTGIPSSYSNYTLHHAFNYSSQNHSNEVINTISLSNIPIVHHKSSIVRPPGLQSIPRASNTCRLDGEVQIVDGENMHKWRSTNNEMDQIYSITPTSSGITESFQQNNENMVFKSNSEDGKLAEDMASIHINPNGVNYKYYQNGGNYQNNGYYQSAEYYDEIGDHCDHIDNNGNGKYTNDGINVHNAGGYNCSGELMLSATSVEQIGEIHAPVAGAGVVNQGDPVTSVPRQGGEKAPLDRGLSGVVVADSSYCTPEVPQISCGANIPCDRGLSGIFIADGGNHKVGVPPMSSGENIPCHRG